MQTIRAILDHVIVKPSQEEESCSRGGIMLPENIRNRPAKGTVTGVGPGRRTDRGVLIPMTVQVGDVIHYGRHTGVPVTLDGQEFLVMRDDDVLAVED